MDTASTPNELNTDGAHAWAGSGAQFVCAKGIAHRVQPLGVPNMHGLATLDAAIGHIRSALGRVGAGNHWPPKLQGVVPSLNARPHNGTWDHAPISVTNHENIQFALRQGAARGIVTPAQNMQELKAVLMEAGTARPLLDEGTWLKHRAANATWGGRAAILDISKGVVTTRWGQGQPRLSDPPPAHQGRGFAETTASMMHPKQPS